MEPVVARMIVDCGPGRVVSGEEFAGGEGSFYKGANGVEIVHPFRPPPPEFVERDRRAGSILNFRQVRHGEKSGAPLEDDWDELSERSHADQKFLRFRAGQW